METDEGKDENKEMSKSQSTLYKVKKNEDSLKMGLRQFLMRQR